MIRSDWLSSHIDSKISSAVGETIAVTSISVLLGYWFHPDAPFFSTQGFSWLIIGPLLSGLRYGFAYALMSVVLLLGVLALAQSYQLPWASGSLPAICLPLLWIAFVTGEFRNYWERRIRKLNASTRYLNQRLNEVSKTYSLTRTSHDRLQELVISQASVRNSIIEVHKQIMNANARNGILGDVGSIILRAFSDYGEIQEATLHDVAKDRRINPDIIGSIGNPVSIDLSDPLLIEAIRTGKTASIKSHLIVDHQYYGSLLLAIPLTDVFGNIWGLVAVHRMPFRSYRPENIKLISILAGYIGDLVGKAVSSPFPEVKDENLRFFILQVMRCLQDIANHGTSSVILGFEFNDKQNREPMNALVMERKRGTDESWGTINRNGNQVLFLLMPLTSSLAVDTYIEQLEDLIEEKFSFKDLQAADTLFHQQVLLPTQNVIDVMDILSARLRVDIPWQAKVA